MTLVVVGMGDASMVRAATPLATTRACSLPMSLCTCMHMQAPPPLRPRARTCAQARTGGARHCSCQHGTASHLDCVCVRMVNHVECPFLLFPPTHVPVGQSCGFSEVNE